MFMQLDVGCMAGFSQHLSWLQDDIRVKWPLCRLRFEIDNRSLQCSSGTETNNQLIVGMAGGRREAQGLPTAET